MDIISEAGSSRSQPVSITSATSSEGGASVRSRLSRTFGRLSGSLRSLFQGRRGSREVSIASDMEGEAVHSDMRRTRSLPLFSRRSSRSSSEHLFQKPVTARSASTCTAIYREPSQRVRQKAAHKTAEAQRNDPQQFQEDAHQHLWDQTTTQYLPTLAAISTFIANQAEGMDYRTDQFPDTEETHFCYACKKLAAIKRRDISNKSEDIKRLVSLLKALIAVEADVQTPDKNGIQPLYYLITSPCFTGFSSTDKYNFHDLLKALMVASGIKDNNADDKSEFTVLMHVIHNNNVKLLELLLERGANPGQSNKSGKNPLFFAIEQGKPRCLDVLIKYEDALGQTKDNGKALLFYAIEKNQTRCADVLLKHNVNPDQWQSHRSTTPLIEAICQNNPSMVSALLDYADVNFPEQENHTTPLMMACVCGYPDIVERLLLAPNILINSVNNRNETALMLAILGRTRKENPISTDALEKIIELLFVYKKQIKTNITSISNKSILYLVLEIEGVNDRERILKRLEQFIGFDLRVGLNSYGMTALAQSVYQCDCEKTRFLLERGFRPHRDRINNQSLLAFAFNHFMECTQWEKKIEPGITAGPVTIGGNSAGDYKRMMELLIKHYADINDPLQIALDKNNHEYVAYFMDSTGRRCIADMQTPDKRQTLLTWAIQRYAAAENDTTRLAYMQRIEKLLNAGANPDLAITDDAVTPLMLACELNLVNVIVGLCPSHVLPYSTRKVADVNKTDRIGNHALLRVSMNITGTQHPERLVTRLVMLGSTIHHYNDNDETALFHAVKNGNLSVAQAILSTDDSTSDQLLEVCQKKNAEGFCILGMLAKKDPSPVEIAIAAVIYRHLGWRDQQRAQPPGLEAALALPATGISTFVEPPRRRDSDATTVPDMSATLPLLDSDANNALLRQCMDLTHDQPMNLRVTNAIIQGASPYHLDQNGETALFHAVKNGNLGAVQAIVSMDDSDHDQFLETIKRPGTHTHLTVHLTAYMPEQSKPLVRKLAALKSENKDKGDSIESMCLKMQLRDEGREIDYVIARHLEKLNRLETRMDQEADKQLEAGQVIATEPLSQLTTEPEEGASM